MFRLEKTFKNKNQQLLNVYFTAGFPALEDTGTIIRSLSKSGVDVIEVGMPYSDPMADGPTIQKSGMQALENGMSVSVLFSQLEKIREEVDTPLILMGYFNQVMQFGEEAFLKRCQAVGVDGLILPDLPLSVYETEYQDLFKKYDLAPIFLITPQTSEERIRKIDQLSRGFIYVVSSAAITGNSKEISPEQVAYFERIENMNLRLPRMIGFGISDHQSFTTACQYADGAIIGSAFIRALENGNGELEETIEGFVKGIRNEPIAI